MYIVMYHYVRDLKNSRYPKINGLEYKNFKKQLDFFMSKYVIIKMEDLIDAIYDDKILPKNAVLLTFDDGYIDHFKCVYPLLKKKGLQGSFFVPGKVLSEHTVLDVNKIHFILASVDENLVLNDLNFYMDYYRGVEYNFPSNKELFAQFALESRFDNNKVIYIKRMLQDILPQRLRELIINKLFDKYVDIAENKLSKELYISTEQLKCMKNDGMFIGVHGYEHYWLGNLDQKDMKNDIEKAIEALSDIVDENCWVMNYPYGSYNNKIINYVANRGCCLGITTEVRKVSLDRDNKYLLPRLDTNDFPPISTGYLKFDLET